MNTSKKSTENSHWMAPKTANKLRKIGIAFLRILVPLGLLILLGLAVYNQWNDVRTVIATAHWGMVLIGLLFLMLSQPLMGWISWCILKSLGQTQPFLKISTVYFISQAAKYLPGGIWAFPSRVVAYQAIGVEKSASVVSLVEEISALFLGATLVGLTGLLQGLPVPAWVRTSAIAGVGACIAAVLVFQLSISWKVAQKFRLVGDQTVAAFESQRAQIKGRWLVLAMLGSFAFWFLVGIGFHFLVNGINQEALQLSLLQAASLFALAWCAGFVIILAPAGLGVREAAISVLLLPVMGASHALSIALVARLWWTMGEAGFILIALLWSAGRWKLEKPVSDITT
jgi:uncharacterized membrane protein YbhN (UPF0104 family)